MKVFFGPNPLVCVYHRKIECQKCGACALGPVLEPPYVCKCCITSVAIVTLYVMCHSDIV